MANTEVSYSKVYSQQQLAVSYSGNMLPPMFLELPLTDVLHVMPLTSAGPSLLGALRRI